MVLCVTHGEIKGTEGTINLIVLLVCLQCQQVESFGYYDNSKQVGTRMTDLRHFSKWTGRSVDP